MSETNVYVTKETFDKMREELQRMKSIDRPVISTGKGLKGWDDFIQKNPARLKK